MTHTIKNEFLTVAAAEKGGELQSIRSHEGIEYLWQGDSKYWSDRALNIFPYVARLTEGSYYMDGQLHQMAIHGLAPYAQFSLVSNDGQTMVLEMTDNAETWAQYPRHFAFRIVYALKGNVLETTYEVENRDEKAMHFGLGGHPGFNVPLVPNKRFEDYRLRFGESCQPRHVGFNEACFVTGEHTAFPLEQDRFLPLRHEMFDNDAIVLDSMSRQVTLECETDAHKVTVTFPQMGYLGLWHWPRTDAPYICIEPWCSLPSNAGQIAVFEEQKDLIHLAAGETYCNTWTIEIT
jgi:galactose mutarotase-like enzyme